MNDATFPAESFDKWKTTYPHGAEYDHPLQPRDPCAKCGCAFREHHGRKQECWKCAKHDEVCDGFELDESEMDAQAEAIEADRQTDEAREGQ